MGGRGGREGRGRGQLTARWCITRRTWKLQARDSWQQERGEGWERMEGEGEGGGRGAGGVS